MPGGGRPHDLMASHAVRGVLPLAFAMKGLGFVAPILTAGPRLDNTTC